VRDAKALAAPVREALEVVEVAAVRDRPHLARAEPAHLTRDGVRHRGDRIGVAGDELCDECLAALLRADCEPLDVAIRVGGDRVAQVGHPGDACRLLDHRADQVHRGRRRRREQDVDPLLLHDAPGGGDRGQAPGDELVRHEQPAREEHGLAQHAVDPLQTVQLLPG
jgi:hypothetical protein